MKTIQIARIEHYSTYLGDEMETRLYQESGCDRCTYAEKRNEPPHVTS